MGQDLGEGGGQQLSKLHFTSAHNNQVIVQSNICDAYSCHTQQKKKKKNNCKKKEREKERKQAIPENTCDAKYKFWMFFLASRNVTFHC